MELVQQSFVRHQLLNRRERIARYTEAFTWATHSRAVVNLANHLPPIANEEGRLALRRYERTLMGRGREIYAERLWGTIGNVGWSGTDARANRRLDALDTRRLAVEAFLPLLCTGIAAGVAYRYLTPAGREEVRIDILTGYLEPMVDAQNTSHVVGLLQMLSNLDGISYEARFYNYDDGLLYTWPQIKNPAELEPEKATTERMRWRPRFVVAAQDENGLPLGEIAEGLPLLVDDLVYQVKLKRLEEGHAFPLLHVSESAQDIANLGSQAVIVTRAGGRVERVLPGDLSVMVSQHERLLEQIRRHFALRAKLTTTAPLSGTSITEANQHALSAYAHYADVISQLLTGLVRDYARLEGIDDPPAVTVEINREATRSERITETILLFEKGLISLDMAVGEITKYVTFSDEQVREFLQARGIATPEDVMRLFGGA